MRQWSIQTFVQSVLYFTVSLKENLYVRKRTVEEYFWRPNGLITAFVLTRSSGKWKAIERGYKQPDKYKTSFIAHLKRNRLHLLYLRSISIMAVPPCIGIK